MHNFESQVSNLEQHTSQVAKVSKRLADGNELLQDDEVQAKIDNLILNQSSRYSIAKSEHKFEDVQQFEHSNLGDPAAEVGRCICYPMS